MRITVFGLGHLGTVAAGGLAAAGHDVMGLDIDEQRVQALRAGRMSIYEPELRECVASGVDRGNLQFSRIDEFAGPLGDIALVATGTPATPYGEADLTQVRSALAWIKSRRPIDLTIVMKSTVPPGSGTTFVHQDLKGTNACYVSNPEFLREGRALQDWFFPDRIVVGCDTPSSRGIETIRRMYSPIETPLLVTDITSAEMIKYASNAFLATRISFINEIASLCDAVGASVDAVSDGLALDGRNGKKVYAGVGYGGSCFPKDIRALEHMASAAGLDMDLLGAVAAVNDRQRAMPVERLLARFGEDLRGVEVGVLGLAFKPGTDDLRGAVSLDVIGSLAQRGARVRAYDPQASQLAARLLPGSVDLEDTPEDAAVGAQALLLLTEWKEIGEANWEEIASQMRPPRFLFDGRNALDAALMSRFGFEYVGVGRGNTDLSDPQDADKGTAAKPPAVHARSGYLRSTPAEKQE